MVWITSKDNLFERKCKALIEWFNERRGKTLKLNNDGIDTVIGALEKQTAKKMTHEATLLISCTCPSCKNVMDQFERFGDSKIRVTYQYCHFCGQKLDWSDISGKDEN